MIDNYLEHLIKKIDDKVNQLQEDIGYGNAKSFEEYKASCGEIKGLLSARLFITDLKHRLKEDDDE